MVLTLTTEYQTYLHPIVDLRLKSLKQEVEALRVEDPVGYKSHPITKLLAKALHSIRVEVPKNPAAPEYQLGNTIKPYKHWRRVKKGLPNRYRLFFRYSSAPPVIVHAWMNDEHTLRKAGAKTDVYTVFRKMLLRQDIPDNMEQLIAACLNKPAK
ncbi:toxin YhaV [Photobacterium damselae subsp. damselae]|nr:toxin YhaV [Photobacterium damselae subsp. damselae]